MTATKPSFCFPYPTTPSHGSWCLAVALIGQADFDHPQSAVVLTLDKVFAQADSIPHEWLKEAVSRAKEFDLTVYESADFEESDFSSMCFFPRMGYRNSPNRIEADLHHGALPYLKQLQQTIQQLHLRSTLSPSNLAKQMKAIAPLTVYSLKKNPRYEGPMLSFFSHKGQITLQ